VKYDNDWGQALNFDGDHAGGMRDHVRANAAYWIGEFHFDGLRLDAVQTIHDSSSPHIISCLSRAVHEAAGRRNAILVAESEDQKAIIARPESKGGYGIDAVWNDDFHHSAIAAMTGRNPAYYSDHAGFAQEFISAAKYGYLFQGQTYAWQGKRRGTPALDLDARQFLLFLENHDQVANSATGARLPAFASPAQIRAFTGLLLLLPGPPMLFQGQEFQSSRPFVYFSDAPAALRDAVIRGRREFLAQFPNIPAQLDESPCDRATFDKCKLDWSEFETNRHVVALHRDLLALRRADPVFSGRRYRSLDGAVLGREALVLRFFGDHGDDRLLFVNYGPDIDRGSFAEPLIAPPEGKSWRPLLSSEDRKYGGAGIVPFEDAKGWHLTGHSTLVLTAG
jgi:maltooligosyltrehalose trehalohydrolase